MTGYNHLRWSSRMLPLDGHTHSVFACVFCRTELFVKHPAPIRELCGAARAFNDLHERCKPPYPVRRETYAAWENEGGA